MSEYSLNLYSPRMPAERPLTRRRFVQSLSGTAAALFSSSFAGTALASADPAQAVLRSRPHKKTEDTKTGMQPLGLGFGRDGFIYVPDVRFIDEALALAFRQCNIDPTRIALGGFSDGAS